jgi:hypothetical protein
VTTPAPARPSILKVYPIEDLADDEKQSASVVEIIQATIEPSSWQMLGGPGVVIYFPSKKALVVRQTPEVHKELTELLALLRDKSSPPPVPRKK